MRILQKQIWILQCCMRLTWILQVFYSDVAFLSRDLECHVQNEIDARQIFLLIIDGCIIKNFNML